MQYKYLEFLTLKILDIEQKRLEVEISEIILEDCRIFREIGGLSGNQGCGCINIE